MSGDGSFIKLRLASAQRKIRAFLRQLDDISAGEFPYTDGLCALYDIKLVFETWRADINSLPPSPSVGVVTQICNGVRRDVNLYTVLLGFILRSTNLRNAFEIIDPLKRIARATVRTDVRLILSSEWDYVPLTYPMNVQTLRSSVFVGMPAQESRYALCFAIAGHEIGHSVWRQNDVNSTVLEKVTNAVHAALEHAGPDASIDVPILEDNCRVWAMRQVEEIFCDMFSLMIFGESYLYAFDYLLGPGGWSRTPGYPSVVKRNEYLKYAARKIGVPFDEDIFSGWVDSTDLADELQQAALITDESVSSLTPYVLKVVSEILASKRKVQPSKQNPVCLPKAKNISRIENSFVRLLPYQQRATLPEILCAGWRRLRALEKSGQEGIEDKYETLNELVAKSIEISEFLGLADEHAERR